MNIAQKTTNRKRYHFPNIQDEDESENINTT